MLHVLMRYLELIFMYNNIIIRSQHHQQKYFNTSLVAATIVATVNAGKQKPI